MKINKRKLMLFGLPVLCLVLVSAVVLPYLFSRQTTIDTAQTLKGIGINVETVPCNAGYTCLGDSIKIESTADRDRTVQVTTTEEVGIEVSYVGILELDNKDSSWALTPNDGTDATLKYTVVGEEFGYSLNAEGLETETEYSLIYYADKPDRFVDWGGNNPGAMIVTAFSDSEGNLVLEGSVELGMNLPSPNDANINEHDYSGELDNYLHAHGAKIWVVPTNALPTVYPSDDAWAFWSASGILFETDLIWYSDSTNELTIPANSFIEFYPQYVVSPSIVTGNYELTTEVIALN